MAVVGAAIVAGCGSLAGAASHARESHPDISVFWVDSTSGPVVQGIQNGNGIGVEGVVGATVGAIGMAGFANNAATANIGLEGVVRGPNSVGLLGQALLASGLPSIGLEGTSNNGVGVEGQSLLSTGVGVLAKDLSGTSVAQLGVGGGAAVLGTTGSGTYVQPGVDGESSVHGGSDAGGLFGFSGALNPANATRYGAVSYGLTYASFGRTLATGADVSHQGFGTAGFDGSGTAAIDFNAGALAVSGHGIGLLAGTSNTTPTLIGGGIPIGAYVTANASGGSSGQAVGVLSDVSDTSSFGISTRNRARGSQEVDLLDGIGDLVDIFDSASNVALSLSDTDNMNVRGHLTANGIVLAIPGASGNSRATYGHQSTMPSIEDFGEGRLVNGQAVVRIDPSLADAIDQRTSYLVYVTPQGDSRGLYVSQKSPQGFMVRENQGGRSNLVFDYRIVARPLGSGGSRLAVIPRMDRATRLGHGLRGVRMPQPLTPEQELVNRLGVTRASQLFAQYRAASAERELMLKRLPYNDASGRAHLGTYTAPAPRSLRLKP